MTLDSQVNRSCSLYSVSTHAKFVKQKGEEGEKIKMLNQILKITSIEALSKVTPSLWCSKLC